jgi:hypothetical protein
MNEKSLKALTEANGFDAYHGQRVLVSMRLLPLI